VSSISNRSRGTLSTGFKLAAPQISDTYVDDDEDDDEDDEDHMEGQQPSQRSFHFNEEQAPPPNYSSHSKPSDYPMMTSERTSGEGWGALTHPPTPTTHDPSSSHPSSHLRNEQRSSDIHSQVSHPQSYPSNGGQSHHSYHTGGSTAHSTFPPLSTIYKQDSLAPQARSISAKQKIVLWCICIIIGILFFAVIVGVVVALTMNNNDPALAVAPTLPPAVVLMPPTVPVTPPPISVPSATPTISAPSTIPSSFAPTGTQESVVPDTLERIQIANLVKCGVVERLGFATAAGINRWTGMEVDLCKAVAAATLQNSNLVDIISLTQEDRFTALASGEIDVLAGMTTFTMERDVHEVSYKYSIDFGGYDFLKMSTHWPFPQCSLPHRWGFLSVPPIFTLAWALVAFPNLSIVPNPSIPLAPFVSN
jgi:hypothetical protein